MKRFLLYLFLSFSILWLTSCAGQKEPLSAKEMIDLAQSLSIQMAEGNFSDTHNQFSALVKLQLSEAKLKTSFEETVASIGDYVGFVSSRQSEQDGFTVITCSLEYTTSGLNIQFTFNDKSAIDGLWFSYYTLSEVESGDAFTETELSVGEYHLDGRLTLPRSEGPFPVVILVHGSGQSDLNETIGNAKNQPFRDIAHKLAEEGIASIRYNKRYYQCPETAPEKITISDEVLDDVNAAIDLVKQYPELDSKQIYVLGHSLGGILAPAIAKSNPAVCGIILLAGSPRNLADIIYDQNEDALRNAGYSEDIIAEQMKAVETEVEAIKALTSESHGEHLTINDEYWYSLNENDPAKIAPELTIPMLILQGEADFQVYPDKDFSLWKELLAEKENCTFHLYPGLNHLFMKSSGKKDATDYDIAGTVSDEVIQDITKWIIRKVD